MAEPFIRFNKRGAAKGNEAANPAGKAFTPTLSPTSSAAPCGTPVVTVKRDGQKVTQIQIQCSCGQVIELDCVY